jgi:hypothetical protein
MINTASTSMTTVVTSITGVTDRTEVIEPRCTAVSLEVSY